MNRERVIDLASQIVKLGDGESKEEFMAALSTAVASSIYHCYQPQQRWNGVTQFCAVLSPALQAVIDGYERKRKVS